MTARSFWAVGIGCFSLFLFSQVSFGAGDLAWAKRAGGTGVDQGAGIAALGDGSALATGGFSLTATFGPGEAGETVLTSSGGYDAFLARYNPGGTLAWAKKAGGGTQTVFGAAVAVLPDGAGLVTGSFSGNAAFGLQTLVSAGEADIFVARYSPEGTPVWAVRAGGANADSGSALAVEADGSCVITGTFRGTASFGAQTLESYGDTDIFVARYNSNGTLAWAKRAGGLSTDGGRGIAVLGDGSFLVSGYFQSAVDFSAETWVSAGGFYDLFVARYNADGTLAWVKQAGGTNPSSDPLIGDRALSYGAAPLGGGSSVITGTFLGSAAFGKGEPNETTLDSATRNNAIFIARYNPDGTLAWAKKAGGGNVDSSIGIAATGRGGSAITGRFKATAVFGPGEANETTLTAIVGDDIFVAGYNADGTLAWARRAGGTSAQEDSGHGISSPGDGSCLVTGKFFDNSVFGPGEAGETELLAAGGENFDIFVARYQGPAPAWLTDFNGDGTSDIAIFRPASGLWAVRGVTRAYFGSSSDIPVPADYNGSGATDIAIFRPASGLWVVMGLTRTYFGTSADLPIPRDYNGNGTAGIGIFRPASGLWAIKGVTRIYFGSSSDTPVPGYYDGPPARPAIFRPASGLWAIKGVTRIYFGSSSDTPVPGDYIGSGNWAPAIFRFASGLWAVKGVTRAYFGAAADTPLPGGYRGDGVDGIGIFRLNSGLWAVRGLTRAYFGNQSDIPVTR